MLQPLVSLLSFNKASTSAGLHHFFLSRKPAKALQQLLHYVRVLYAILIKHLCRGCGGKKKKHPQCKKNFSPSFSVVRKGFHGNFTLSTALLLLSVCHSLHCVLCSDYNNSAYFFSVTLNNLRQDKSKIIVHFTGSCLNACGN